MARQRGYKFVTDREADRFQTLLNNELNKTVVTGSTMSAKDWVEVDLCVGYDSWEFPIHSGYKTQRGRLLC